MAFGGKIAVINFNDCNYLATIQAILIHSPTCGLRQIQHTLPSSFFFLTLLSDLKVHNNENFFGSDFECCITSLLVMLKY